MHNSTISLFCWVFPASLPPWGGHVTPGGFPFQIWLPTRLDTLPVRRSNCWAFCTKTLSENCWKKLIYNRKTRETHKLSLQSLGTSTLGWHCMEYFTIWLIKSPILFKGSGFVPCHPTYHPLCPGVEWLFVFVVFNWFIDNHLCTVLTCIQNKEINK